MDLSEARKLLDGTVRHELRDHAFGDREVTWMRGEKVIAEGYFGASINNVTFLDWDFGFTGQEARSLLECGTLSVERNDSTGPDNFQQGVTMPGLTKEGVFDELTKEK